MRSGFRLLCLAVLLSSSALAAIWPDQIGGAKLVSSKPVTPSSNVAVWTEYGFEAAEQAQYAGPKQFSGTAWRFKDATGAVAVFEWQASPEASPAGITEVSATIPNGLIFVYGNYLIRLDGWQPGRADLEPLVARLPRLEHSPLPPNYLPPKGMVPNTRRYGIGPAGLELFQPGVPASVAAFHLGAEFQVARYRTSAGEMPLAVYSYPTPQIARQRVEDFQKLPGVMARRSGPLVGLIPHPSNADAAEKLLASVKWNAHVTDTERVPNARDNVADLILNIFTLIGIILVLFVLGGLGYAVLRRLGFGTSGEAMTVLNLGEGQQTAQAPPKDR